MAYRNLVAEKGWVPDENQQKLVRALDKLNDHLLRSDSLHQPMKSSVPLDSQSDKNVENASKGIYVHGTHRVTF